MGAGTDSEIAIRFGHFELLKKDIGHGGVVVLSGVNESLAYIGAVAQGAENRRGFHEVGARTDNVEDVHGLGQRELYLG